MRRLAIWELGDLSASAALISLSPSFARMRTMISSVQLSVPLALERVGGLCINDGWTTGDAHNDGKLPISIDSEYDTVIINVERCRRKEVDD